jgi:hypothetical protein
MIGILIVMATVILEGTWIERTYGQLGRTIYIYFGMLIAILCTLLLVLKIGNLRIIFNRKGNKKNQ